MVAGIWKNFRLAIDPIVPEFFLKFFRKSLACVWQLFLNLCIVTQIQIVSGNGQNVKMT